MPSEQVVHVHVHGVVHNHDGMLTGSCTACAAAVLPGSWSDPSRCPAGCFWEAVRLGPCVLNTGRDCPL